jgi:hypothetical protein
VVQVGFDVQTEQINGSALTLGALMFLVVTIPLARLVDWLIGRQQAQTGRGGPGRGEGVQPAMQPLPSAGGGGAA